MSTLLDWIQVFLVQHSFLAPIVFTLTQVVFAVCLIPCSPLAVIAGMLWGKWLGLGISIVSAFIASCATFWLSRLLLKQKIYAFMTKRYAKTDWFLEQTKKHGWKFVATVQLNPAAPGSSLGYLFGLTGIDFFVYAFFLLLFMLPLQLILVICGDSFPALLTGKLSWIFVMALVFAVVYIGYGVKHEQKTQ